jgi:hypothetical protein
LVITNNPNQYTGELDRIDKNTQQIVSCNFAGEDTNTDNLKEKFEMWEKKILEWLTAGAWVINLQVVNEDFLYCLKKLGLPFVATQTHKGQRSMYNITVFHPRLKEDIPDFEPKIEFSPDCVQLDTVEQKSEQTLTGASFCKIGDWIIANYYGHWLGSPESRAANYNRVLAGLFNQLIIINPEIQTRIKEEMQRIGYDTFTNPKTSYYAFRQLESVLIDILTASGLGGLVAGDFNPRGRLVDSLNQFNNLPPELRELIPSLPLLLNIDWENIIGRYSGWVVNTLAILIQNNLKSGIRHEIDNSPLADSLFDLLIPKESTFLKKIANIIGFREGEMPVDLVISTSKTTITIIDVDELISDHRAISTTTIISNPNKSQEGETDQNSNPL